jgi:hypothetical protein
MAWWRAQCNCQIAHGIAVAAPGGAMAVQRSGVTGQVQQGVTPVPDMILQYVDSLLAERVKALAKERQCTVNDVLLHALRNGLGISAAQHFSETRRDPEAPTILDGHWEAAEKGAFEEALNALARTCPTQLAPERIRFDGSPGGAE